MKRRALCPVLSLAGVLALGGPAAAAVYRWVDDEGVVNYSDDRIRYDAHRRRSGVEPDEGVAPPPPRVAESSAREPASEPVRRAAAQDAAAEIMRLAGADRQCVVVSHMMQAAFGQWAWRVGRVRTGPGAVANAFGPEMLTRRMHAELLRRIDPATSGPALAWLRSPLSQRIVALETASIAADRRPAVAFVDALPSAPPPAARVALLHRVERAADVSLNSVAVVDAVRIAVRQSLGPVADPASAGQGGPAPFRLPVGEEHRLRVLLSMLFAYRDVSDIDLGRYAAFLESPSGRWLTRVTHQALLAALAADAPSAPSRPGRATPTAANAAVPRTR
jgi:Domain of unknown function (DUF4124)